MKKILPVGEEKFAACSYICLWPSKAEPFPRCTLLAWAYHLNPHACLHKELPQTYI